MPMMKIGSSRLPGADVTGPMSMPLVSSTIDRQIASR